MTEIDKFIIDSDDAIKVEIESKVPKHFDDTRVIFYQKALRTLIQNASHTRFAVNCKIYLPQIKTILKFILFK